MLLQYYHKPTLYIVLYLQQLLTSVCINRGIRKPSMFYIYTRTTFHDDMMRSIYLYFYKVLLSYIWYLFYIFCRRSSLP